MLIFASWRLRVISPHGVEFEKARLTFRWYAAGRRQRFGMAESLPAAREPEPSREPERPATRVLISGSIGGGPVTADVELNRDHPAGRSWVAG